MKIVAGLVFSICLICLTACHREISDAEFIRCWGGQLHQRTAQIRFEAVAFPRGSTISSSEQCPDLRMKMEFYEESTPTWFPAFEVDDKEPFQPRAIEGEALVRIKSRDAERMVVVVERLISGRIVTEGERQRRILEGN